MQNKNTLLATFILLLFSAVALAQQPNYVVNFGTPEIDGSYDPAEWDAAAIEVGTDGEEGENWTIRQTGAPDPWGFKFQALYDDDYFYLVGRSNYEGISAPDPNRGWGGFQSTMNLYFDPNIIPDDTPGLDNASIDDGYQVAFRQNDTTSLPGAVQFYPAPEGVENAFYPGVFIEAHTNSPWGNNSGAWSNFEDTGDGRGLEIYSMGVSSGEINDEGDSTVFELKIPWEDFDAGSEFIETPGADFGLFHPQAPDEGAEWNFTAAWIPETEGTLPSWHNQTVGAFAPGPHGTLTFGEKVVVNPGDACDFDMDGDCDVVDIDALLYTGIANNDTTYDLDGSGTVDTADRNAWLVQADSLPGDATLDGIVKADDLNEVGVSWQQDSTSWATGDFNGDGFVDAADLNDVGVNWQNTAAAFAAGQPAAASAVPEPSGALTGLMAVLGLLAMRRRRRS